MQLPRDPSASRPRQGGRARSGRDDDDGMNRGNEKGRVETRPCDDQNARERYERPPAFVTAVRRLSYSSQPRPQSFCSFASWAWAPFVLPILR